MLENIRLAFQGIWSHMMRSFLTMLGIIIGIASIIAIVSTIKGTSEQIKEDLMNPVSHVAYGYATQMCILDKKTGKIEEMVAAHDVGKAVNPLSCEGQIEGGVVMSIGFALREHYPIDENCKPIDKYGSLGLFRSHEIPKIDAIVVDKPGLNVACGAIGIGEITSIPTAPAIADAYFRCNGERQYSLPLTGTPYERKC